MFDTVREMNIIDDPDEYKNVLREVAGNFLGQPINEATIRSIQTAIQNRFKDMNMRVGDVTVSDAGNGELSINTSYYVPHSSHERIYEFKMDNYSGDFPHYVPTPARLAV
jgi:hypothetical protein